jgi:hypothetical protein
MWQKVQSPVATGPWTNLSLLIPEWHLSETHAGFWSAAADADGGAVQTAMVEISGIPTMKKVVKQLLCQAFIPIRIETSDFYRILVVDG